MILLPMEIIDKILSYRETHPVVKLIKNRSIDFKKALNDLSNHVRIETVHDYEHWVEYLRLIKCINKLSSPHFNSDRNDYNLILSQPDYKLFHYEHNVYNYRQKYRIIHRNSKYPL